MSLHLYITRIPLDYKSKQHLKNLDAVLILVQTIKIILTKITLTSH